MKIKVLGSGCSSCHQLFELTKKAVKELDIKEDVEYTEDIKEIIGMGVMEMPILAIDGKPVLTGAVSDIEKIKNALRGKPLGDDKPECSCCNKC
jgi:small redox-active disulfide protein 2